ncbi:adenylyltransferase/cytidyltransferase family protein [Streptomyces sp. ISL-112]|uniref:adenylyltransferase/cytidyltransferase family protein n=1 Tax=unclassified Streptomyces TaxID=2593676 RepID=UPI001BE8650A|nr:MULTISPECIES: adenylyltransferase/cytidyltransferase family protein [unclassified Streptomyces]MBT2427911.1 adenylyltransferase/cytidyltransferase family protein [Streptomyces sp. ISL-112]MBT2464578.1 adenylyltransferase/cytidyltransferase family protein [Streptomyces sp. ISL-63]
MRALFPGSFDPPVTQGHQDILRRAALLFDEVVVCVMFNANKAGRFPVPERLDRLRAAATDLSNVTVDSHTGGLLVDYCGEAVTPPTARSETPGPPARSPAPPRTSTPS